eukprot:52325-Chlamydomonas_euryale.AAC.1
MLICGGRSVHEWGNTMRLPISMLICSDHASAVRHAHAHVARHSVRAPVAKDGAILETEA